MKRRLTKLIVLASISFVSSLTLVTVDWRIGNQYPLRTMLPVTAASPSCSRPVGRVLSAKGESRITPGQLLCPNDVLEPPSGAKVIVLCYAKKAEIWNVPSSQKSTATSGCPPVVAQLDCTDRKNGCRTDDARSPYDARIPNIISPRSTLLLTDRPRFKWSKVEGAQSYTLRVTGPAQFELQETVTGTELDYPTGLPPLKADSTYGVIVQANNTQSSAQVSFTMLSQEQREQVQSIADLIRQLNVTEEEKALELARFYSKNKLRAEAIELLEGVVEKGSQKPLVYRMLGDLYLWVEQLRLAEAHYSQALKLATNAADKDEKAASQAGLWRVNVVSKNWDAAIRWLKEAQTSYQDLGNTQLTTEFSQYMGELYLKKDKSTEALSWFQKAKTGYETLEKTPENLERLREVEEQLRELNRS